MGQICAELIKEKPESKIFDEKEGYESNLCGINLSLAKNEKV